MCDIYVIGTDFSFVENKLSFFWQDKGLCTSLKGREGALQRALNQLCTSTVRDMVFRHKKSSVKGKYFLAFWNQGFAKMLGLKFVKILWCFGILTLVNCNSVKGMLNECCRVVYIYIQDDVTYWSIKRLVKFMFSIFKVQ